MNDKVQATIEKKTTKTEIPQDILERLLFATLKEQRSARRWKIFFRFVTYTFLVLVILISVGLLSSGEGVNETHTALIDVKGLILDDKPASADNIIASLKQAFEDNNTKGIILRINSPGGSPVQVSTISQEIKRQRKLHPNTPIYAVCTDICASGGYWLAAATDKIYANQASLVGSIGVVMESFGFVDIMKKVGIERRLITAGAHKGIMDPFSPAKPEEVAFIKSMLAQVHSQFISYVKQMRGKRLKINDEMFTGLVWTGADALKSGLIDGIATEETVAREIIKAEYIVDYTVEPNYLERLANQFNSTIAHVPLQGMEKTIAVK